MNEEDMNLVRNFGIWSNLDTNLSILLVNLFGSSSEFDFKYFYIRIQVTGKKKIELFQSSDHSLG